MAGEPRGVGSRRPDATRTAEGQEGTVARDGVWGGRAVEEETSGRHAGQIVLTASTWGVEGSTGENNVGDGGAARAAAASQGCSKPGVSQGCNLQTRACKPQARGASHKPGGASRKPGVEAANQRRGAIHKQGVHPQSGSATHKSRRCNPQTGVQPTNKGCTRATHKQGVHPCNTKTRGGAISV